jgi:DNA polymerase-2
VRTDWTPLAQQFQQELYLRIFRNQPYQDYVRETIARLMNGELDEQLVYRKRLRRPLAEYQRNVPPHVRAARLADEHNLKLGGRSSISSAAPSNTSGPPAARSRWIISSRRSITITI